MIFPNILVTEGTYQRYNITLPRTKGGILIRAVILAAGKGERMQPLTDMVPKALLPCLGTTLLQRLIAAFQKAGIDEFTVAVGWKGDMIREYLQSLKERDRIEVIDVPEYERGPLQTLITTLDSINDKRFLISPVDYVVDPAIVSQIFSDHVYRKGPRFLTIAVDTTVDKGMEIFMGADELVTGIGKPILDSQRSGRSAMLLGAGKEISKYLEIASTYGDSTVASAINRMILYSEPVYYLETKGEWFDIDNLTALLNVNKHLLNKESSGGPGYVVVPKGDTFAVGDRLTLTSGIKIDRGVRIIGPVYIDAGTKVDHGCTIGPYVYLAKNTRVESNCKIEDAIVFGNAKVMAESQLNRVVYYKQTSFHEGA
jgi:NDP-sugar pyrophosphorylase family protein